MGREDIFRANVSRFKIDLSRVKHVVISHEDWNHIAGLKDFRFALMMFLDVAFGK